MVITVAHHSEFLVMYFKRNKYLLNAMKNKNHSKTIIHKTFHSVKKDNFFSKSDVVNNNVRTFFSSYSIDKKKPNKQAKQIFGLFDYQKFVVFPVY